MEQEKEIYQKKKGDIYNIDPRLIRVQKGFNSRVDFGDINELATATYSLLTLIDMS